MFYSLRRHSLLKNKSHENIYGNQKEKKLLTKCRSLSFSIAYDSCLFLIFLSLITNRRPLKGKVFCWRSTKRYCNMKFILCLLIFLIKIFYGTTSDLLTKYNITLTIPENTTSVREIPYVCILYHICLIFQYSILLEIHPFKIYIAIQHCSIIYR